VWPAGEGRPRRAAVSSFGISGTNAHLILEEDRRESGEDHRNPRPDTTPALQDVPPLTFSARAEQPLRERAAQLRALLAQSPDLDPADLARALVTGRATFDHRAVVLAQDRAGLLDALDALAGGLPHPGAVHGTAGGDGGTVFVFPGQGSQWIGMALELLETSQVFRERMHECAAALAEFTDWSLLDVLRGEPEAPGYDRVDVVQPVLFAVMVSLAALWRSLGVRPDAVVGHSQGEIAAACVAGALSLRDAARVVALRSRALAELAGTGGMVSVPLPAGETERRIRRWGDRLAVAAVNSPGSTVVSGDPEALEDLLAQCAADGVRARRIPVDYASHSPHVETIRERLLDLLAPVEPREAAVPFFSAVTGGEPDDPHLDAEYWYRNLRQPVRFDEATRALLARGHRTFIEVSAHPVLTMALQDTIAAQDAAQDAGQDAGQDGGQDGAEEGAVAREAVVLGSLRRDEGGMARFLTSAAEGYVNGLGVDWSAVTGSGGAPDVELPTYPFQHQSYWLEPAARTGDVAAAGLHAADHPLLGAAVPTADGDGLLLTGRLSLRTHPWLADHAVGGTVLLPGTAFLELALEAARRIGCGHVEDLTVLTPLVLTERAAVRLQVTVGEADDEGRRTLTVHSQPDEADEAEGRDRGETPGRSWTRHATGAVRGEPRTGAATGLPEAWPPAGATPVDLTGAYDRLADDGYEYGPAFQGLRAAWRLGDDVYAEVALGAGERSTAGEFGLHPALLDAALHPVVLGALGGDHDEGVLPFSWNGVSLHAVGAASLRVRLRATGRNELTATVADATGAPVATVGSLALRPVDTEALRAAGRAGLPLLRVEWQAFTADDSTADDSTADDSTADDSTAEGAAASGMTVWSAEPAHSDPVVSAHEAAAGALEAVRECLSGGGERPLVVVTRGAVAVVPGEVA
ncbi:acyltransferase domain-containing protein, partial [Streptomyces barkulensis]